MPPLRSDRAPRACEGCRRLKTRCYPSKHGSSSCLRCETQHLDCSLKTSSSRSDHHRNRVLNAAAPTDALALSTIRIEERLNNLETLMHTLVGQLNSLTRQSHVVSESRATSLETTRSISPRDEQDAPVLLIRGIAEDVCTNRHQDLQEPNSDVDDSNADPIALGMIGIEDAHELLKLRFHLHYGRWVNFDDDISIDQLMARVRSSSLLFYSICLVAARHTTQRYVNDLAPAFFREARKLLQASLLTTPQSLEFFQAVLLLSLWSTTIGQVPLSIDSWLLTSYALQQGLTSSMTASIKGASPDNYRLRACCTWNHICLAHLQYCVGTGRKALLQEAQIERCTEVLQFSVSQFEVRMVAELKLYWIMVTRCCAPSINLSAIRTALHKWRKEWSVLFDQPRFQFLEMGYNFALLLALCRSLHSQSSKLSHSKLNEMVRYAKDIIDLAKAHTDERTPHLTDHIYHIITFSAITLCQLVTKYSNILIEPHSVAHLQNIVLTLVEWLRSIGPASHISRFLANVIVAHYTKYIARDHRFLQTTGGNTMISNGTSQPSNDSLAMLTGLNTAPGGEAMEYLFQDHAWNTFFDFNADTASWPQSSELIDNSYTPTNESWTVSVNAVSP